MIENTKFNLFYSHLALVLLILMDIPIIMYNHFSQLEVPLIIQRGLKSGSMNFPNLELGQIPDEFLDLFPKNSADKQDLESLDGSVESENDEKLDEEFASPPEYLNILRLNLSSNRFTCIPVILCSLTNLQVLDFQDNKLTKLPHEIGLLVNLYRIVLSHNQLISLTSELYSLKKLRYVIAQDNKINRLEPEIGRLTSLECLDLSHNLLEEIPPEFGFLKRLTRLNLAENRLTSLPDEIGRLEALQILDLTQNLVACLPQGIGDLRSLELLSIRRNQLVNFPSLFHCATLKELHLGGNSIQDLQEDKLYPLTSLKVLELRDNKIQNIPDGISVLNNLVRLDLSNNSLDDLPGSLSSMPSLKALTLDGNRLDHIAKKLILLRGTQEILEYLRNRSEARSNQEKRQEICSTTTTTIPCDVTQPVQEITLISELTIEDKRMLQYNRTLNYSRRHAKEIPEEIFTLASPFRIHTMKLNCNRLTSVPTRIKDFLHLLIELDFSFNLLCELPSFLGYAPHLRVLDVQDNQIFVLPNEISLLRQLKKLNISKNKFYEIPKILYEMHWLEMLFVGNNSISELDPTGLCKMKGLQVLDVCNNCIKTIPYQLGHMTQLRRLQLSGNPFRQPRANVIARGTTYVMDWLRDRIPNQSI